MTCSLEGHRDRQSDKDLGSGCCCFLSGEDRDPLSLRLFRKGTQSNSHRRWEQGNELGGQGRFPGLKYAGFKNNSNIMLKFPWLLNFGEGLRMQPRTRFLPLAKEKAGPGDDGPSRNVLAVFKPGDDLPPSCFPASTGALQGPWKMPGRGRGPTKTLPYFFFLFPLKVTPSFLGHKSIC